MPEPLSKSARRVQDALHQFGCELAVLEMNESTRTAQDAALAIGCTLGQIAKSLVFMGRTSGQPVLVIACGSNRVDMHLVESIVGEKLDKASADQVLEHTGYVIGGIPPVGHTKQIRTLIDVDLAQYSEIWAAAGTPRAVFKLTPELLQRICGGQIVRIA